MKIAGTTGYPGRRNESGFDSFGRNRNIVETIRIFMNWNGTTKNVTIREKEPKKNSAAMEITAANTIAPN